MQGEISGSGQISTAEYGAFLSDQVMENTFKNSKCNTNEMALEKGHTWALSPRYSNYSDQAFSTIPIQK